MYTYTYIHIYLYTYNIYKHYPTSTHMNMSTLQTPPLPTTCSHESHKQARAGAHTSQSPKAISYSLHIYAMEKAWATDPSAVTP